jgi:hypothetical protein
VPIKPLSKRIEILTEGVDIRKVLLDIIGKVDVTEIISGEMNQLLNLEILQIRIEAIERHLKRDEILRSLHQGQPFIDQSVIVMVLLV